MGVGLIIIGIAAYIGSYLLTDICCEYTYYNLIGDILKYVSLIAIIAGIIWIIVGIIKKKKSKTSNS
jgi:hypothetical protein